MPFPKDTQEDLDAFYSRHRLGADGKPTVAWESANIVRLTPAYPLTLSLPPRTRVTKVRCHRKVADSLKPIFEQILQHYGSVEEVRKARMHLYAGCYEFRKIAGANRLSTHAWGASIDLNSENNPQGKPHDERSGMMPMAVVRIFEAEGWKWGGRFKGKRVDCMHFEATE